MSDEDDFDEEAHDKMLQKITNGGIDKKKKRTKVEDPDSSELVNDTVCTINVTDARDFLSTFKKKQSKKAFKAQKTLPLPLPRIEQERIQRAVHLRELQKDLRVWQSVVTEQKAAQTLSFPLNRENISMETAAERLDNFIPRTSLEKSMEKILGASKHRLTNDKEYTEAEMEIIRSLNVKEAKERCANLQRIRAIQSCQEAKYRRQAKIKSKNYHRIMKRQKRRQMIKEIEDLRLRDPEAAKERIKNELERDRIMERATLKHRSANRFSKVLTKYAENDEKARAMLQEHTRFGRELRVKTALDSESDSEEDEENGEAEKKTVGQLLQEAAVAAEKEALTEEEALQLLSEMRKEEKRRAKEARKRGEMRMGGVKEKPEKVFEEVVKWNTVEAAVEKVQIQSGGTNLKRRRIEEDVDKREQEVNEEQGGDQSRQNGEEKEDADVMFDRMEEKIVEKTLRLVKEDRKSGNAKGKKRKQTKTKKKPATPDKPLDVMLDPNNYLHLETGDLSAVAADLTTAENVFEQEQAAVMAEAFVDDDVIADFDEEKADKEEEERAKDVDLTLKGWGSWAGPGINNNKKKKFIVKAQEKKRRDKGRIGLIISEKPAEGIRKLQPKMIPFPFTRTEDFEAALSVPLGRDWNSSNTHRDLCKPAVLTQGGRVILPLNKAEVLKSRFASDATDD